MRANLLVALLLLIIAVVMYILPESVLQDFRLLLFDIYAGVTGKVESNVSFLTKEKINLTSSVPIEEQLRELNITLAKKDAEIAFLKKELRQFAEFNDAFESVRITAAKVIGESAGEISPELTIDKGYLDGVVEGAAVAQGSVIAGVVVRVERKASLVLRTDNTGVLIPARAGKSRDRCSVKGDGYERAVAVFYTGQTSAMVGERIYTSAALGKIPEGLLVGVLEDYPHKGKEPGTLEAPVKLDADFTSLERVIVVNKF